MEGTEVKEVVGVPGASEANGTAEIIMARPIEKPVLAEKPKPRRRRRSAKVIARERAKAAKEKPKAKAGGKRRGRPPGRPKKWLVWRNDKYPNLKVLVPEWQESKKLGMSPYGEFRGGRLDVKRFAQYRKLDATEVMQLNKAVSIAKYVWVDNPSRGQKFKCGHCGAQFTDKIKFLQHTYWMHMEELDINPNPQADI